MSNKNYNTESFSFVNANKNRTEKLSPTNYKTTMEQKFVRK